MYQRRRPIQFVQGSDDYTYKATHKRTFNLFLYARTKPSTPVSDLRSAQSKGEDCEHVLREPNRPLRERET